MADISSVINGSIIGYIISLVLLGITLVQSWIYAHNNHDTWPLRTFVTVLVLLDLTETSCATKLVYHYLISHFGDIDVLKSPTNIISIDFAVTIVIFFLVHIFFSYRLWKLGKSWWLPAIVTFTSTAMLGTRALGASAIYLQISGHLIFSDFHQRSIMVQLAIFHALGVVTDILITGGLSWTLSATRTDFKDTQMLLQRLLAFTISRGILVSLVQVGHIVMYILDPKNMLFWASLHLILAKLYVLTTLFTLNSRTSLRSTLQSVVTDGYRISFARPASSHINDDVEASRNQEDPKIIKTPVVSSMALTTPGGLEPESSTDFGRI